MNKLYKLLLFAGICCIVFIQDINAQMSYWEKESLISDYFKRGSAAYNKQNNTLALYWFQKALMINPDDEASLAMAGISCGNNELYASAIYYQEKALDIREDATTYDNLGITYGTIGYDDLALEMTEKTSKNSLNKYITAGVIFSRHGKNDESIAYMRKAMKYGSPKVPLYNIGVTLYETGNPDSAIYYFDKVIEIEPEFAPSYIMKATVLKEQAYSPENYKPLCEKAIELTSQSTNTGSLTLRAKAYKLLGKKKDMEKDLQSLLARLSYLIELHPDAYSFITDRADAHSYLGNREQAIADYKKSLSINPDYYDAKNGLKKLLDNETN